MFVWFLGVHFVVGVGCVSIGEEKGKGVICDVGKKVVGIASDPNVSGEWIVRRVSSTSGSLSSSFSNESNTQKPFFPLPLCYIFDTYHPPVLALARGFKKKSIKSISLLHRIKQIQLLVGNVFLIYQERTYIYIHT